MQNYECAKIVVKKNGEYYIQWYNIHPSTKLLSRVRKSFNLNRIKDLAERKLQAAQLQSAINLALANEWNYFDTHALQSKMTLLQALKKSMEILLMNVGPETVRTYPSIMNVFITWLNSQNLVAISPDQFTAYHFTEYLQTRSDKSISNVNNHILVIRKLFKIMQTVLSIIDANPLENIKFRKFEETDRYEAITPDELKAISDRLRSDGEHKFLLFTQFILFAFIRPGHLKFLRRSQIDFDNNTIQVYGDRTKSKRNIKKQLLQPLKQALIENEVHLLHPDTYVFGKDFVPALKIYGTLAQRAREKWKILVDDLGIDKRMYSLKHTGAQMYLENNEVIDLPWLQRQMEHSSISETETYVSKRKIKMLDDKSLNLPNY